MFENSGQLERLSDILRRGILPELPREANVNIYFIDIKNSTIGTAEPSSQPPRRRSRREKAKMRGGVFTKFIAAAMEKVVVEQLNNGRFFATIPPCPGVWADGDTQDEVVATLQEALEEWILFKLRSGDTNFPVLGDVDLNMEWKEDLSLLEDAYEADQQAGAYQAP